VGAFFHELSSSGSSFFFLEEYLESQCSIENELFCVDNGSWKDFNFG
jgi:hypothetical protein